MSAKIILKVIAITAIISLLNFISSHNMVLCAERINIIFDKAIKDKFNRRINALRKDTFEILLLDISGEPINKAGAVIEQKKHEFIFGGAISTPLFEKGKYKKEKELILQRANEMFNMVVDGNGFKWKNIEPKRGKIEYGFYRHNLITQWANEHNKDLRHHCLFWSNPKHNPDWLQQLSRHEAQKAILNRIRYTKERAGEYIKSLDLINEMLYFRFYRDMLGNEIIKKIFEEGKKAFPAARIYLNENPLQSGKAYLGFQHYIQLILNLKRHQVPFGGIGLQAHFDEEGFKTAKVKFSEFILKMNDLIIDISKAAEQPVLITEYDMKTKDENLRADFLEAFFLMAFSNRNVEGVVAWEWFDERRKRALVKRDGSLTEAGKRYYDLVFGKWWTKTSGATDENGKIKVDAYFGDYQITVIKKGIKRSFNVTLRKQAPRIVTLIIEIPI